MSTQRQSTVAVCSVCSMFVILAVVCLAPAVRADELPQAGLEGAPAAGPEVGLGLRIGGYGFRDVRTDPEGGWSDCRMNGVGAFATMQHGRFLFTEMALDFYQSTGSAATASGMDRLSLSLMGALGFRGFPDFVVSPIVQVGAGAEYSHIAWQGHARTHNGVLPMGFIGTGGEVKLGDHVRLGANVRVYLMAAFPPESTPHDPFAQAAEATGHAHQPGSAEAAAAGQVQLWARFDL